MHSASLNLPLSRQEGFILPYVLLSIVAISLVAVSAYGALTRSSNYVQLLQDQAQLDLAFASAEAEATYRFITSIGEIGGMRLPRGGESVENSLLGGSSDPDAPPPQIWPADGGILRSDTNGIDILVSYRDNGGLAPINNLKEEDLVRLFIVAGFNADASAKLAAELADFLDPDIERRFRGAERTDYRLFGQRGPTNSPLRRIGEMTRLLSIPDELGDRFWNAFTAITTLDTQTRTIKPMFAIGPVREGMIDPDGELTSDIISQSLINTPRPSDQARFLLTTGDRNGVYRMIEIHKVVNNVDKPWQRQLINSGPTSPVKLSSLTDSGETQDDTDQNDIGSENTRVDRGERSPDAPGQDTGGIEEQSFRDLDTRTDQADKSANNSNDQNRTAIIRDYPLIFETQSEAPSP